MKKTALLIAGLLVLASLVVFRLDFGSFAAVVGESISWGFFLSICLAILLQLVIRSLRFSMFSRDLLGVDFGAKHSLLITSASFFMALATPNKVGDMMRGLFIKGRGAEVTAVSMIEYSLDVAAALLIPLAGLPVILDHYRREALAGYALIVLVIAAGYVIIKNTSLADRLAGLKTFEKYRENLSVIAGLLKQGAGSKLSLVKGLGYTFFFYGVYFAIFQAVLQRLGAGVTFYETVVAASLGLLLGAFSMVPMGVGTRDASAYGVLVALGGDPSLSMVAVVVMRGLTVPLVLASGLCYAITVKKMRV